MTSPRDPQSQIQELLARVGDESLSRTERARLLGQLAKALVGSARTAGSRATFGGSALVDVVSAYAPHVPVRDLLTLRQHHAGRSGEDLAEALVQTASRTTAAIGAAGGALASVQHAAPPSLLLAPVQLAAETLAVVAVELKLVAELHVVFGRAPLGTRTQVATGYLLSWTTRRAVDPQADAISVLAALGGAARQQVRQRVLRRLGRNVSSLAPFLAGAVAAAELNRRSTRDLGDRLIKDLRRAR